MEKVRKTLSSKICLISLLILTILSIAAFAYFSTLAPFESERFQIVHDFGDYYSDDIEVTYYGSFLVAAADGLIEVNSDSSVSSISSFANLSVRDIEIETGRDRISSGVIAYVATNHGVSVFYAWGERRQDLNLTVDAERGFGFNPHRLALSPSGQFLYIYDSINGVYSVDLDHSFHLVDQRFIPELLNESTQSWPFDYDSPMNGLQLTHMAGTNEGLILGGESGLFFFEKTNEVWSNTTFTHQTTTLDVECLSYMPSDRTVFVGIYGGIESYQLVGSDIVSTGEISLPDHEWDAIYAVECDLYFNRLYAGSPNGLYIFFLNNDTSRFYSKEEAQWTGFSVFSIGTIQHQPSSVYFSTMNECYTLDISVQDEAAPNSDDWMLTLYPVLSLIIAGGSAIFAAISAYYRRQSVEIQRAAISSTSSEDETKHNSTQEPSVREKMIGPKAVKHGPGAVIIDPEIDVTIMAIDSPIQCIQKLLNVVKKTRSFLFGRKTQSSFTWEKQHKEIEDNIIILYQQCGKWAPNLGEFIKQYRKCMGFNTAQIESLMESANQIIEYLNTALETALSDNESTS